MVVTSTLLVISLQEILSQIVLISFPSFIPGFHSEIILKSPVLEKRKDMGKVSIYQSTVSFKFSVITADQVYSMYFILFCRQVTDYNVSTYKSQV